MKEMSRKQMAVVLSLFMCAAAMPVRIQAEEITEEPEDFSETVIEESETEANLLVEEEQEAQPAESQEAMTEIDSNDAEKPEAKPEVVLVDEKGNRFYLQDYTLMSEMAAAQANDFPEGWYVVTEDITYDRRISIQGDVNFILCDGATLNATYGIHNGEGNKLTIYGQEEGSGRLVAKARKFPYYQSAIGGNNMENGGTFILHAGNIEAYGGCEAAAIGGGATGNGGIINIYGGTVYAEASDFCTAGGAGIGGGEDSDGGEINIYGGKVTAIGANGIDGAGAGIGGGDEGQGGNIHILGGTVSATGGNWGAGIGGGNKGSGGNIVIDGGTVAAWGNKGGAGIGGGDDADSGTIHINTASVEAHGYHAVGTGEGGHSASVTLAEGIGVAGFPYENRYDVLSYGGDVWFEEMDAHPAKDEVRYLDAYGNEHVISDYTDIAVLNDRQGTIWYSGWYVASEDITFQNRPAIVGEVNLVLRDGVTLNMIYGIRNFEGQTLNIYAESDGKNMGNLICGSWDNQAGIGGNNDENNGTINIYGGHIEATGTHQGAGIGGGDSGSGGVINIYGGEVHAEAHMTPSGLTTGVVAGIGGGDNGSGGMVRIYGGRVYASSLPVDYFLYHAQGAGIGGGDEGNGGTIEIYGGSIEAHGHHAIGAGKDSNGSVDLTLGDAVNVDGVDYNDRYNVLSYGQDIWISQLH